MVDFLYVEIFSRFGLPREIFIDQGTQLTSKLIHFITKKYNIWHKTSMPYHLWANGQVEVTNKFLETILVNIVQLHQKDWVERLPKAFWAYRATWHNTTGFTPYEQICGKQVVFPIEFEVKTLCIALQSNMDTT